MIGAATINSLGEDIAARTPGRQFSSGTRTSGGTPDQIAANITRDQWQHFLTTYKPIEDQVLQRAMQTDFSSEGDEAGATARAGIQASKGTLARNMSRLGSNLTGEERSAIGRRTDLSLTKAVGQAENTTRRGLSDTRTNLLAGLVGIGRGVAQTASGAAQSVADMAAQREMQYKQQKAAATSSTISAAASAAALIIAI